MKRWRWVTVFCVLTWRERWRVCCDILCSRGLEESWRCRPPALTLLGGVSRQHHPLLGWEERRAARRWTSPWVKEKTLTCETTGDNRTKLLLLVNIFYTTDRSAGISRYCGAVILHLHFKIKHLWEFILLVSESKWPLTCFFKHWQIIWEWNK